MIGSLGKVVSFTLNVFSLSIMNISLNNEHDGYGGVP